MSYRQIRLTSLFVALLFVSGCAIETHSKNVTTGCEDLRLRDLTLEALNGYYGSVEPDRVDDLGDGRKEIIYYLLPEGDRDARHWSGHIVFFLYIPVLPLLYPDGHHQLSYVVRGNTIEDCIRVTHASEGGLPPVRM